MYILTIPQKLEMKEGKFRIKYDSEICIGKNSMQICYNRSCWIADYLEDGIAL